VDVQGTEVQARWPERGEWQKFVIERPDGNGAVMPGDTIFLKAHTNNMVEVDGIAVQARWNDKGLWQSLVIRKAISRRLEDTSSDASSLGAFVGAAAALLAVGGLLVLVAAKSTLLSRGNNLQAYQPCSPFKVQPEHREDMDTTLS